MGRRKEYTFRAIIKKKEPTQEDLILKDKIMSMFLDKMLEIAKEDQKLAEDR